MSALIEPGEKGIDAVGSASPASPSELPNVPVSTEKPSLWKDLLSFHKEGMAVIGSTFDVLFKMLPICLVAPAFMIWVYLRKLGWSELFFGALASTTGLVVLLIASGLLALAMLCQFFIPSLCLGYLAGTIEKDTDHKDIKWGLWALCFVPAGIWFLVFGCGVIGISHWFAPNASISVPLYATLAAFVCALICTVWIDKTIRAKKDDGQRLFDWRGLERVVPPAALAALAAATSCSPFLLGLWVVERQTFAISYPAAAYFICAVVSIVALLPGAIAVNTFVKYRSMKRASMGAGFVTLALAYGLAILLANFAPVATTLLRSAGVLSDDVQTFQILKPQLAYSVRATGLPVDPVRGSTDKEGNLAYFAAGFERFGFGPVKLICVAPFAPDAVPQTNDAAKGARENAAMYRKAGSGCIPLKADDIQMIRR